MSRHTAPDELLLDYATGALAPGPALALSLHVALDARARRIIERLEAMGGALLDDEAAPADEAALRHTLALLDTIPVERPVAPPIARPGFEWVPRPLLRHLGSEMNWRRVLGGFDEIRLHLPGDRHRVSLLRLAPGRGLPVHRHEGEEYTVVLQGGYTDATGNYAVGDFAIGPGPEEHEPIADAGEPCIALIVLEQPIVLTGPFGRWLNPLVKRDLI